MIVVPPLAINALVLTSTTVAALLAPAAYSGATTYAFGDIRKDSATNIVYQSLVSNNLGNTPSASPLYWQRIGYNEVAYNPVTTYAIGDYSASGTRVYISLTAGNTGNTPLSSPTNWSDVGPINQYAMFDLIRSTATVSPGAVTVVITPGVRCDTIGFVGVKADSVRVVVTSGGVSVFDQTQTLSNHSYISNWLQYFTASFSQKKAALFTSLPPYTNMVVTVTFSTANGNTSVGSVVLGTAVDIGAIQFNPVNDATNYSKIVRDDFGTATLTPRRSVPKLNCTTWLPKEQVDNVISVRDNLLNGAPALWAGLSTVDDAYFASTLILGVYKSFPVNLAYVSHAVATLEVEEI